MPNETNEMLTPEQFFEAHSFASDYIRREDFLKYCEQFRFINVNDRLPKAGLNSEDCLIFNGIEISVGYFGRGDVWVDIIDAEKVYGITHYLPFSHLLKP